MLSTGVVVHVWDERAVITMIGDVDNSYRGIRVVVLGATGFIGRWVALKLCQRGAHLFLMVRKTKIAEEILDKFDITGTIVRLDLRNRAEVRRLFSKIRPVITFNMAGYGVDHTERQEEPAYEINAQAVTTVCEAIAEIRCPEWRGQDIVHVGSALEYGPIGGHLSEDSVPKPTTLYGKSKLAGTLALKQCCINRGLKGITARLFMVYGPGEYPGRLFPTLLETARTGNRMRLTNGAQKKDFTYVEDVAEGFIRLGVAEARPGEIINLATGRLVSVRAFVETGAKILRIPSDSLQFGTIPPREEQMEHLEVNLDRLRELIAWTPSTEIENGIRKSIAFERGQRKVQ